MSCTLHFLLLCFYVGGDHKHRGHAGDDYSEQKPTDGLTYCLDTSFTLEICTG